MKTTQALDLSRIKDDHLSKLSRGLVGSEVLRIAAEIRALIAQGQSVCNLTVGDFDPREFRPPDRLLTGVQKALAGGHTNYPPSNGTLELRQAVARFYAREFGLEYPVESVLVAGGARPLIYATYRALVDPGDRVAYPVPSRNNNHYCYLTGAERADRGGPRVRVHPPRQVKSVLPSIRLLAPHAAQPTGTAIDPRRWRISRPWSPRTSSDRPAASVPCSSCSITCTGRSVQCMTPTLRHGSQVAPYTCAGRVSKSRRDRTARGLVGGRPAVTQRMSDLLGHRRLGPGG
jgi:aspartate aminotransferase